MKNYIVILSLVFFGVNANSQSKKSKDIKSIKSMQGCYKVTFNFAETFNYLEDSNYVSSPNKTDYALEWIDIVEANENKIMLQHILQAGVDSNAYIIKHWRQDWRYQDKSNFDFIHSNTWKIKKLNFREVQGKWTQKVFQVDDSPRYEGSASWVHVDGKHFWENTVDAPLPRRERTIRSDYNVMKRMNRVEITDYGWSHKQDNEKIVRKDNESDFILAKEYGHNTYVKVDDNQCIYAKKWWDINKNKWKTVRLVWEDIFNNHPELKLKKKVEEKRLWQFLFSDDYKSEQEIRNVINKFVL